VELSCEDNDNWGPKDKLLRLDWRAKYSSFGSTVFDSVEIKKEPAILKKFETLEVRRGSIDNPGFIPDNL